MKAIHIDFSPQTPGRVFASMRPGHWLLAGFGVIMGVLGNVVLHEMTQQQDARQAELEQMQIRATARSEASAGTQKTTIPETQAGAVNNVIRQLNLPWDHLLTAIEQATPSSVALLELDPDAKKHLVRGVAEASTASAMLAYIKRLKQEPFLGSVILTRHEINEQDANTPLRFEFAAEWQEAGQ